MQGDGGRGRAGDGDPLVFVISFGEVLRGKFQVINGYKWSSQSTAGHEYIYVRGTIPTKTAFPSIELSLGT